MFQQMMQVQQQPPPVPPLNMAGIQPNFEVPGLAQKIQEGDFSEYLALLFHESVPKELVVEPELNRQAIHFVAHFGNMEVMKALVEHFEVDLFALDGNGYNVVHYAASSGEIEML